MLGAPRKRPDVTEPVLRNYIGGRWEAPKSSLLLDVEDPAEAAVIAKGPVSPPAAGGGAGGRGGWGGGGGRRRGSACSPCSGSGSSWRSGGRIWPPQSPARTGRCWKRRGERGAASSTTWRGAAASLPSF